MPRNRTGEVSGEVRFDAELVPIGHEIRTNYAIADRQGLTVKLDQIKEIFVEVEVRAVD